MKIHYALANLPPKKKLKIRNKHGYKLPKAGKEANLKNTNNRNLSARVETFASFLYHHLSNPNSRYPFGLLLVRYDNLRAFEKHLEGAKLLRFSPLYFIVGKDPYESQEAINLLLHFLLPPKETRELALSIFIAPQAEEKELGTALYSSSLFSKTRVLWIQQAEKLNQAIQENLEKYFIHPLPSQFLIVSASSWKKSSSFYKMAEKEGIILEFPEVKPWEKEKQLVEWVNKQATVSRKLISYQVCQSLVKRIGNDQAILAQELEKIFCYCGEKKEITLQDVEAICPRLQSESIWQLGEALFRRDAAAALRMAHALLLEGQALLPLLRQIRSQFQTEYQICLLLAQGKQAQDIAQEFPYMKGPILDRHLLQAKQYGLDAFKRGLLAIDAAEMRSKNSSVDEKIVVELLIVQLTQS
jgi:DNA polymerase III subunit delta